MTGFGGFWRKPAFDNVSIGLQTLCPKEGFYVASDSRPNPFFSLLLCSTGFGLSPLLSTLLGFVETATSISSRKLRESWKPQEVQKPEDEIFENHPPKKKTIKQACNGHILLPTTSQTKAIISEYLKDCRRTSFLSTEGSPELSSQNIFLKGFLKSSLLRLLRAGPFPIKASVSFFMLQARKLQESN